MNTMAVSEKLDKYRISKRTAAYVTVGAIGLGLLMYGLRYAATHDIDLHLPKILQKSQQQEQKPDNNYFDRGFPRC